MAYQQTATIANVEFLKSSGGLRAGRQIRLNYGPQLAPAQLQGRIDPALWADFMGQVQVLADRHPYMAKPGGKEYSNWIFAALVGAVIGLFCFSPDAGSYPQWEAEVSNMLQQYQPAFNKSGLTLSLQHNRYKQLLQGSKHKGQIFVQSIAGSELFKLINGLAAGSFGFKLMSAELPRVFRCNTDI